MKIIGIGDLLIPAEYIERAFADLRKDGHIVETITWKMENYEELQKINLIVEQQGPEQYTFSDDFIESIQDAEILITQFCPVNRQLLDRCKNLKLIGVLRGGVENINVEYAASKNIAVCATPGRNANAVADFTVGLLLSECRNIARSYKNLKTGNWVRDYANAGHVPDLAGKRVAIIGLGEIWKKVAARLHAFDMEILGYDPYAKMVPEYIRMDELMKIVGVADFITIHSRLTENTRHMINAELIKKMKSTAYFINTARSGLVDETALFTALKKKEIMGAAIDVFDIEPLAKDCPFLELDNITITPHLAGGTADAFYHSPYLLRERMSAYGYFTN